MSMLKDSYIGICDRDFAYYFPLCRPTSDLRLWKAFRLVMMFMIDDTQMNHDKKIKIITH